MRKILILSLAFVFLLSACGRRSSSVKPSEKSSQNLTEDKFQIALNYEDGGSYEEAIDIYFELVQINPYNTEALNRLYSVNRSKGIHHFEEGEFKEAVRYLENAFNYYEDKDIRKKLVDSLMFLESQADSLQTKEEYIRRVLKITPENINAMDKLANIYEQKENYHEAIDTYEEILEIEPQYESARMKLVRLYSIVDSEKNAEEVLSDIESVDSVNITKEDFNFYYDQAVDFLNEENFESAARIFEALYLSKHSDVKQGVLDKLIQSYFYNEEFLNIIELYFKEKDNLDLFKNDDTRYFILKSLLEYERIEDYNEAYTQFKEKGFEFDEKSKIYLELNYNMVREDFQTLEEIMEKVLNTENSQFISDIYNELAFYFAQHNEFEKTVELLNKNKNYSSNPEIWFNEGIFLDRMRKYKQALNAYKKACEIDPENPKFRYYLILSLKRNSRFEEMEEEKQHLINNFSETRWANYLSSLFGETDLAGNTKMFSDAESYYNFGIEFAREGKFSEALENFKTGHRIQPENFNILINIGNVYYAQNQYPEAIAYYLEALQFSPNNSYINFFLGRCFQELNLYEKAMQLYRKSYEMDEENEEAMANYDKLKEKDIETSNDKKVSAYRKIGIACFNEEFYNRAYDFFVKVIELESDDFFSLSSIVHSLIRENKYEKARSYLDRLLFIYPDKFQSKKIEYQYYYELQPSKAYTILENMLEDFGDDKWVYENLIKMGNKLNKEEKVEMYLEKILNIYDDDQEFIEKIKGYL
ncbi:MAG: tetratricopeptide repeat protein [Candidatus Muiribacteriota bacterium]